MPGRATARDTPSFSLCKDKINHKHTYEILVYPVFKDVVTELFYILPIGFLFQYLPSQIFFLNA